MISRRLHIRLHSFWHVGTGRGGGARLDAEVARTPEGLPFVPGRTIKGMLRSAVDQAIRLGHVTAGRDDFIRWFGSELARSENADHQVRSFESARYATSPGSLHFGSAFLGRGAEQSRWVAWASQPENRPALEGLYRELASTRVNEFGVAEDHTLRCIEAVVPAELEARIDGPADDSWPNALAASLPLLCGLGTSRSRGLGRATFSLGEAA